MFRRIAAISAFAGVTALSAAALVAAWYAAPAIWHFYQALPAQVWDAVTGFFASF